MDKRPVMKLGSITNGLRTPDASFAFAVPGKSSPNAITGLENTTVRASSRLRKLPSDGVKEITWKTDQPTDRQQACRRDAEKGCQLQVFAKLNGKGVSFPPSSKGVILKHCVV
jgi:hypothetical protein